MSPKNNTQKYRKMCSLTLRNISFISAKPWVMEKHFSPPKKQHVFFGVVCLMRRGRRNPVFYKVFARHKQKLLLESILAQVWTLPSPKPYILQCFLKILQGSLLNGKTAMGASRMGQDGFKSPSHGSR